jgi:hypothetical protein
MSADKTYLDRQLKSPFSRMGTAWYTVWLAKLPILAPRAALRTKVLLLLAAFAMLAYALVPRVPCWLEKQCQISSVHAGNGDLTTEFDQAPQSLKIATLLGEREIQTRKKSGIFSSNTFVLQNSAQQLIAIYHSDEVMGVAPFELQLATLRRNWDGGWRITVDNHAGQKGELLLSPLGSPRLIRYTKG